MAKIDNIIYGTDDDTLLNKIENALTYSEAKWENLEPTPFDEVDYDYYKLSGHSYKNFYRCFSSSIPNLCENVLFKNSNYITYFSNISIDGLMPEKISVLLKSINDKKILTQEVLGTQILNYFGCNTPFNFVVKSSDTDKYLASIDFISENEKLVLFEELGIIWTEDLNAIHKQLETLTNDRKSVLYNISEDNLTKLKEDLTRSFLARYCAVRDYDYDKYNCGLLINKKIKKVTYIDFDFELSLKKLCMYNDNASNIKQIMLYSFEHYPQIYNEFVEKVKTLNNVLNEITFTSENKYYKDIIAILNNNLNNLLNFHQDLMLDFSNLI